jgi:hypothetical protein
VRPKKVLPGSAESRQDSSARRDGPQRDAAKTIGQRLPAEEVIHYSIMGPSTQHQCIQSLTFVKSLPAFLVLPNYARNYARMSES